MTRYELTKIVKAAKEFIAAHERRGPQDTSTLNERQALALLAEAIDEAL